MLRWSVRFLLTIDGEAYFFRNTETEQKIVVPKGSHTLQIINDDPDSNSVAATLEYNFTEDITDISINHSGSLVTITTPNSLAESDETPALPEGTWESVPVYPGDGESIVTIQRKSTMVGAAHKMKIWIDGEEVKSDIIKGMEVKLLVADGEHTIQADSSNINRGAAIIFTVSGEEIVIFAEPMGLYGARFKLTETGKKKL